MGAAHPAAEAARAAGPLSPTAGGTSTLGPEAVRNLAEAREHLAFVIPEFEAMKMQPALERALRLRERLEPAASPVVEVPQDWGTGDRKRRLPLPHSSQHPRIAPSRAREGAGG